jgi:hypothetical protein
MTHRARPIAALQEQECQPVVGSSELRCGIQCPAVRANRFFETTGARICDRDVLQDLGIVRMIAQREPVGGERGVEVALPLEREGLAQVVNTSRIALVLGLSAQQAAPPRHAARK